jgi:hypothetical protein
VEIVSDRHVEPDRRNFAQLLGAGFQAARIEGRRRAMREYPLDVWIFRAQAFEFRQDGEGARTGMEHDAQARLVSQREQPFRR